MDRSSKVQALQAVVAAKIAELKVLPPDDLVAIGYDTPRTEIRIGGKSYDLDIWSEAVRHDAQGVCVVIARLVERQIVGSTHHVQGFVLCSDGKRTAMTESELWQYD